MQARSTTSANKHEHKYKSRNLDFVNIDINDRIATTYTLHNFYLVQQKTVDRKKINASQPSTTPFRALKSPPKQKSKKMLQFVLVNKCAAYAGINTGQDGV